MSLKQLEWARLGASTLATCVALTFLAQGAIGSNEANSPRADVCEDLYSVACLNTDGSDKNDLNKKSTEQLLAEKAVSDARDQGARAYGAKNFYEGLASELAKNGFKLAEPLEADVKERLLANGSIIDNIKNLASGQDCARTSKQLKSEAPSVATAETAEAFVKKVRLIVEGQRALTVRSYAKDLPSFINHLASECYVADQREVGPDDVELARQLQRCRSLSELKRQAALLMREDARSPEFAKRAEAFVEKHLERDDIRFPVQTPIEDQSLSGFASVNRSGAKTISTPARADQLATELSAKSPWDRRVSDAKDRLRTVCADPNTAVTAAVAKIYGDYASKIARSKTTIESLQTSLYSSARRQKIQTLVSETQDDLNDVISQLVSDSGKRAKIQSGYDSMKLAWMETPQASVYTNDEAGKPALDSEKYQRAFQETGLAHAIDVDELTADPTLSGFKTSNAFYNPDRKGPAIHYEESIEIGPGFLSYADSNPEALRTLIGHELGHRIGVSRGLMNGFDLKPEFAPLLACYANSKSIRMQTGERDETLSDYLASEVLARRLSRLPQSERRTAAARAMAPLCAESNFEVSEGPRSIHPRAEFRIAGIFGASPNLRLALGCEGAARDFKTCGLPNRMTEPASGARSKVESKPAGAQGAPRSSGSAN